MATTSPDGIWTPDATQPYALPVDLMATADSVQDALTDVRSEIPGKATQTEVNAGTNDAKYVTPKTLREASALPFATATGRRTTSTSGSVAVTFPTSRFNIAPIVTGGRIQHEMVSVAYIENVTATGFDLRAFSLGGVPVAAVVDWTATQMTPSSATG